MEFELKEDGDRIALVAGDRTILLSPVTSHRLGALMMERSRFMVSKPGDDPARSVPWSLSGDALWA